MNNAIILFEISKISQNLWESILVYYSRKNISNFLDQTRQTGKIFEFGFYYLLTIKKFWKNINFLNITEHPFILSPHFWCKNFITYELIKKAFSEISNE